MIEKLLNFTCFVGVAALCAMLIAITIYVVVVIAGAIKERLGK